MKSFTDPSIRVTLSQNCLLFPLSHQPYSLVPDPLGVVPRVVGRVVVAHVRAGPVGGREPGVVGHASSLENEQNKSGFCNCAVTIIAQLLFAHLSPAPNKGQTKESYT